MMELGQKTISDLMDERDRDGGYRKEAVEEADAVLETLGLRSE